MRRASSPIEPFRPKDIYYTTILSLSYIHLTSSMPVYVYCMKVGIQQQLLSLFLFVLPSVNAKTYNLDQNRS